jgi:hypothetical protein
MPLIYEQTMIEKRDHVRIISAIHDVVYKVNEKEIYLPDIGKGLQLSLRDSDKPIGVLRLDTDEKFLEFFELIKKSKF